MSSRESILKNLKAARSPFVDVPPVENRREVVLQDDLRPEALRAHFIKEAEKLSCQVTICASAADAIEQLLALLGDDRLLLSWDLPHIPLPGLAEALEHAGIKIAAPADAAVRVGLTGIDVALASTGSFILFSGPGKPRAVSLLPDLHVAVMTAGQIVPNLETWSATERANQIEDFRQTSSVLIVSGPSRTADIAMQLVLGAHGPAAVHILMLP
ncbi:MAG: LUD domain-containing protein [Chloroflexi bacterium]|nr:LUD domain-containing protein [Chloroflexota bacterium]